MLLFRLPCPLSAQTQFSTSTTTIVAEAVHEPLPPKPGEMSKVPLARVDIEGDPTYSRPLSSYLVNLFREAQRPRLTEGENFDYVIHAIIATPPTMTPIQTGGGKLNAAKVATAIGGYFVRTKVPQLPEDLNFDKTNLVVEIRCGVELRLLNRQKEIIEQRCVQVLRTNNLKAICIEFNGFSAGGGSAGDVDHYLQGLTRTAANQAMVNFTAYQAAIRLLQVADKHFLETPPGPEPARPATELVSASVTRPDSTPSQEAPKPNARWLTPAEFAAKYSVSLAAVMKSLENGQIKKCKNFGGEWSISPEE
ncbi:MAG TPA: hypothetical protein VMB21_17510 [Candidatus Limnocylindria bacterium]|nr:hypothetical protein [Candidatus Limnocylindria bacterium]